MRSKMKVDKEISEDEAALYDRQIRLWGVDAQKKLLSSRVLLVNMQGLGAEVAKNLVLSGINSLTLLDSNNVREVDFKSNFLINQSSLDKNRAGACIEALQILNPLVKISSEQDDIRSKDAEFFDNFDLVCALTADLNELEFINNHCRQKNIMFLSGFVFGPYGVSFIDLGKYQYLVESPKIANENDDEKKNNCCGSKSKPAADQDEKLELEQKSIDYLPFNEFISNLKTPLKNLSAAKLKRVSKAYLFFLVFHGFYETHKRLFLPNSIDDLNELIRIKTSLFDEIKIANDTLPDSLFSESFLGEFCPVNAIMGGVISQEIVKAISKKNEPINNFFIFDGNSMSGEVMRI